MGFHALEKIVEKFQNPGSIFYWPYLVSAILITLLVLIASKEHSLLDSIKLYFSPKIWFTKSTCTDVVVSAVYMLFFNVPTLACQYYVFKQSYQATNDYIFSGYFFLFPIYLAAFWEGALVCLITILLFDFATYLAHRLMHIIPILWDIHAVHHSPEHLNIFSAFRQNPLDRFIRNVLGSLFIGVGLACFHFVFPQRTPEIMIMGIGAGFFIFMLTVNLQHSHVPIHYPKWLSVLVLSPHLHQIHHSRDPKHFNKNFGGIFPYWDMFFGTLHDERLEVGQLKFGLKEGSDKIKHSIIKCYVYPIQAMMEKLKNTFFINAD